MALDGRMIAPPLFNVVRAVRRCRGNAAAADDGGGGGVAARADDDRQDDEIQSAA